jgi:uncharacterized phage protein (predicted DNA packaging)
MLEDVKLYLRVDGDMEDALINGMIAAAKEYIKSASGKNKLADGRDLFESDLVKTAVKMLVAHWYDNRGVQYLSGNFKNVADVGYSFTIILGHITTSMEYIYDDAG